MPLSNHRFARPLAFAVVAGFLSACTSPLSPGESRALEDAEARWAARPFQSYAFEMRVGCFCAPALNDINRIEVVAGTVTRVVSLTSGTEVPAVERVYFPTIERLFDDIRRASREDWVDDIEVQFDGVLGYPTSIRFQPKRGILDAGSTYELRNASAIP
jgi:hypothetical protein